MQVAEIKMDRQEARRAYLAYRASVNSARQFDSSETVQRLKKEDEALTAAYRELAKGNTLINLPQSMSTAGCDPEGLPRLAIARADAAQVWFDRHSEHVTFWWGQEVHRIRKANKIELPVRNLPGLMDWSRFRRVKSAVPIIPASLRPADALARYHILFEAEWREVPPVDPILLKHISGPLYAVLATWELTSVEQAVLGIRIAAGR
jgi:hypothetical protein